MSVVVHEVTPQRPELLEAMHAVRVQSEAELHPDDPPPVRAELAGELFTPTASREHRGWVALVEDRPVGELVLELEHTEGNERLASLDWLATVPDARHRGVASSLLRAATAHAADRGRTSLLANIPTNHDGEDDAATATGWAERLGLTFRIEERLSRLRLADLDDDLMARWEAAGRERDDGYRIVQFEGDIPDEHMGALVDAQAAMGDMPLDDLDWHPPTEDAAYLTEAETARQARGMITVRTVIVAPDGSGAASSELLINTHRPVLAYQGDTGVVRTHRGRGLGRWIKAENLAYARSRHPEVAVIETWNAESNPWMLDINVAMGFRPHIGWLGYQGDLAVARGRLG